MKKDLKNSPAVAGVLILVLVGSLGKTAMTLMGGPAPVALPTDGAPKPVPMDVPRVTAAASSGDKIKVTPAVDTSSHDPFYHPSLAKLAQPDENDKKPLAVDPKDPHLSLKDKRRNTPVPSSYSGNHAPLQTFPVSGPTDVNLMRPGANTFNPTRNADGTPTFSNKSASLPAMPNGGAPNSASKQEPDVTVPTSDSARISAWRLKAVLRGSRNVAILEGVGQSPVSVAAGDRVRGIRVVSVTAKSITLSSEQGVWMLGLQTKSDGKGDDKQTDSAGSGSNDEGDKK